MALSSPDRYANLHSAKICRSQGESGRTLLIAPDRYANLHSAKICGSQGEKQSAFGFASKTAMQTCIALKSAPRKGLSIVIKCPNVMDYCKVFFGVFPLRFQRLNVQCNNVREKKWSYINLLTFCLSAPNLPTIVRKTRNRSSSSLSLLLYYKRAFFLTNPRILLGFFCNKPM